MPHMEPTFAFEAMESILKMQKGDLIRLSEGITDSHKNPFLFVRHQCRCMQHLHDHVLLEIRRCIIHTIDVSKNEDAREHIMACFESTENFMSLIHRIRIVLPIGDDFEMNAELETNLAYRKVNRAIIIDFLMQCKAHLDNSIIQMENAREHMNIT